MSGSRYGPCEAIEIGIYNPYAPQILGQEWAPIRDEDVTFSPVVNALEIGHEFTLTADSRPRDARFYLNNFPQGGALEQVLLTSIYPRGAEGLSGPIRRVVIPCNNAAVTAGTLVGGTAVEVLADPSDNKAWSTQGGSLEMFFAFNAYQALLANKRILAVNLLFSTVGQFARIAALPVGIIGLYLANSISSSQVRFKAPDRPEVGDDAQASDVLLTGVTEVTRVQLGEVNHYWSTALGLTSVDRMPWRYVDLQRFEATAGANRLRMFYQVTESGGTLGFINVRYAAMEVLFCEETRVAYGGRAFGNPQAAVGDGGAASDYVRSANPIPLRDLSHNTDPVLPAGRYSLMLSSASIGDELDRSDNPIANSQYPTLNGCRELYSIPPHTGRVVDLRYPPEDHLDDTFTTVETRILPQLSIHTSGGPLTEVHVYGRQAIAQVFGSITATQDILDSAAGGAASWPWVRFYARRFGETTVPLLLDCATIAGSTVEVSPEDFDALPEIIDGWKEITLRFDTPPTMGAGTTPQWRWSATGEVSGNRWEILGASAPAVSGVAGNLLNLVPSPNQLSSATYGQPSAGAAVNLGWIPQYAPAVTATADDQTSDAVILFAQDMRTITGLAAVTQTQDLTGIGLQCDVAPCCIPTALLYHRITWPLPYGTGTADDTFTRTEAAGSWGSADSGQAYTLNGTAGDFSVDGSSGLIIPTATGSNREAWIDVGGPDQDVTVELEISDAAETNQLWGGVLARLTDASNYYRATMRYTSTSTVELRLDKRVAGAETNLATVALPLLSPSALTPRTIRLQVAGAFIRAKLWDTDTTEPWWQLYTTDTALTTGNNAGCFARDDTTVASTTFTFDNLVVAPPDFGFGYYELQRSDTVEPDWATIMKATSVATTGFSDYEARVATLSSYRIRAVDVYGFEGPWSDEVDLFLPTPGASGGCIEAGHVLLFTSNERQDGSVNLAYASAWEANQTVDEGFQFSEANFVQMQGMYNRDYFVAFRPLERGGERFQRTLLVQAAAIAPPTLGDFRGLRDMAWDTVSYICVRDEDANRWLATVIVPSGRVLRDRRLYLAPVDIIEVTATPAPVDP